MQPPPISLWISENFFWVFLMILVLNLLQRRNQKRAGRKRFATLYIAIAAFLLMVAAQTIVALGGNDLMMLASTAVVLGVMYHFREHTFPFRRYSRKDGRKLTWEEILYVDEDTDEDTDQDTDEDTPEHE